MIRTSNKKALGHERTFLADGVKYFLRNVLNVSCHWCIFIAISLIYKTVSMYRQETFPGVCASVKTSVIVTPSPLHNIPVLLSCQCETISQRWKQTRPLPPSRHAPSEWTTWLNVCPPCPAAGGVCFTGLCNAGPRRIRFHRYKSFRFNPITESEWSGLRASA